MYVKILRNVVRLEMYTDTKDREKNPPTKEVRRNVPLLFPRSIISIAGNRSARAPKILIDWFALLGHSDYRTIFYILYFIYFLRDIYSRYIQSNYPVSIKD